MQWVEVARAMQRIVIVILLVGVVCWLAIDGKEWAQTAISGAFGLVIGFLFGERARSKADG